MGHLPLLSNSTCASSDPNASPLKLLSHHLVLRLLDLTTTTTILHSTVHISPPPPSTGTTATTAHPPHSHHSQDIHHLTSPLTYQPATKPDVPPTSLVISWDDTVLTARTTSPHPRLSPPHGTHPSGCVSSRSMPIPSAGMEGMDQAFKGGEHVATRHKVCGGGYWPSVVSSHKGGIRPRSTSVSVLFCFSMAPTADAPLAPIPQPTVAAVGAVGELL